MHQIPAPAGHSSISKSIYDRQLDTALFKRLLATNFTLASARSTKVIGPGAYNPLTIDEVYRQKSCSKYGPYYQQSERFPSITRKARRSCNAQTTIHSLSNVTDELQRKHEFERRFNAIRLDRQSDDRCYQRKASPPRAPPVTLYEKTSFVDELRRKQTGIYGPYVKLAEDRHGRFPEWYKGPARFVDKSILQTLFSSSQRHKGKFLPIPSHRNVNHAKEQKPPPGPTTYFNELPLAPRSPTTVEGKKPSLGFLSSTERFQQPSYSLSHLGPAFYKPSACQPLCSKRKQINTNP